MEIPIRVYTDSKNLHRVVSTLVLVEDSRFRVDLVMSKETIGKKESLGPH